ncbi:MAG TPA: IS110 family transposase [Magnetococcales bacterium]|nr:IS110 family transposase [Magnetococcales bacterium]
MMAPQFVKPYVKSNKNDKLDAEAICEAVQRPSMRFVPIKSIEQQDLQSLHRIRSMVVAGRTALINQTRGLLMEYGIVLPKGPSHLRTQLPEIIEDTENGTTVELREMLRGLRDELVHMDERIDGYNAKIKGISQQNESCRLLQSIPGIGPLIATALIAAVGDVSVFKNGREMAAWLGLVPRQHSTGGKIQLLGISKRGDSYLRMLLVHGSRAALIHASKKEDRLSRWATELEERRGWNIATVALAAKNVSIAWALLSKGEAFKVSGATHV